MNTFVSSKMAKFIFAAVIAIFGFMHFLHATELAAYVPPFFPVPAVWVYLSGLGMILYAVSIFLGHKMQKMAGYLVALMLLVFILTISAPRIMAGDQTAILDMLKMIALAVAAIFIANEHQLES